MLTRIVFEVLLLCITVYGAGGGSSNRGTWSVSDGKEVCIMMKAQIDLTLTYYKEDENQGEEDVTVTVPKTATAINGSTCNGSVWLSNGHHPAQILQLTFDPVKLPGWNIRFAFTSISAIGLHEKQYMILQVNVTANYSSDPHFHVQPGQNNIHTYTQLVDPNDPPALADTIYASDGYSLYCPSKQKFAINTDRKNGPPAYIQLSLLQVEAFRDESSTKFSEKETCPADQHMTDKVPLIVGGVLAGLTVLTLAIYLIYRSRLPPEVLHMVNPHSHFDNKALEEDEEDYLH